MLLLYLFNIGFQFSDEPVLKVFLISIFLLVLFTVRYLFKLLLDILLIFKFSNADF